MKTLFAKSALPALLAATALLALGAAADGFTLVRKESRARVVVGANEPEYVFRAAQEGRDLPMSCDRVLHFTYSRDLARADSTATRPIPEFCSPYGISI